MNRRARLATVVAWPLVGLLIGLTITQVGADWRAWLLATAAAMAAVVGICWFSDHVSHDPIDDALGGTWERGQK